jgi:hypothetical protein
LTGGEQDRTIIFDYFSSYSTPEADMRSAFLAGVCLAAFPFARAGEEPLDPKSLIERAIKAIDPDGKSGEYRAATWKGVGKYFGFSQGVVFHAEWRVRWPDRVRLEIFSEIEDKRYERVLVIDGDRGWTKLDGQLEPLDRETLAEERERMDVSWLATLTPLRDKGVALTALGERRVGGQVLVGIQASREGRRDVALYFDKETYLLTLVESKVKNLASGREITQEVHYGEYQKVDGVRRPTRVTVKWDGRRHAEATFEEIKLLRDLPDSTFAKP